MSVVTELEAASLRSRARTSARWLRSVRKLLPEQIGPYMVLADNSEAAARVIEELLRERGS